MTNEGFRAERRLEEGFFLYAEDICALDLNVIEQGIGAQRGHRQEQSKNPERLQREKRTKHIGVGRCPTCARCGKHVFEVGNCANPMSCKHFEAGDVL